LKAQGQQEEQDKSTRFHLLNRRINQMIWRTDDEGMIEWQYNCLYQGKNGGSPRPDHPLKNDYA